MTLPQILGLLVALVLAKWGIEIYLHGLKVQDKVGTRPARPDLIAGTVMVSLACLVAWWNIT